MKFHTTKQNRPKTSNGLILASDSDDALSEQNGFQVINQTPEQMIIEQFERMQRIMPINRFVQKIIKEETVKKELLKIAKQFGLHATITYSKPEFSVASYDATIMKDGIVIGSWDGGYFIGETNSPNSKESMIENWKNFIIKLSK